MPSFTRRDFLQSGFAAAGLLGPSWMAQPMTAAQTSQTPPQPATRPQPPPLPVSDTTRRYKKIDFHTHLGSTNPEVFKLERENIPRACDYLLKRMEEFGVEKALLVPVEPLMKTEYYHEAHRLHPDRFLFAASTTVRPLPQALDALKKWQESGAVALKMNPITYSAQDEAAERLVVEAVRRNLPVLFHHTDFPPDIPQFIHHMAIRYPEGTYVVIHFGGNWGFQQVLPLAADLANVYLETSSAFPNIVRSPLRNFLEYFDRAGARSGFHKVVFGSEYVDQYPRVLGAIEDLKLAPEVLANLYYENAKRILKI